MTKILLRLVAATGHYSFEGSLFTHLGSIGNVSVGKVSVNITTPTSENLKLHFNNLIIISNNANKTFIVID